MGLVGDDEPTTAGKGSRGLEVAGDLDRVVGIGVVDPHSPGLALAFHAPTGSGEGLEPGTELGERLPEPQSCRECGQRVEDVVAAGHLQGHPPEGRAPFGHLEGRAAAVEGQAGGAEVASLGLADGHDREAALARHRDQRRGAGVVGAEHQEARGSTVPTNSAKAAR